jgi:hypothetical protein
MTMYSAATSHGLADHALLQVMPSRLHLARKRQHRAIGQKINAVPLVSVTANPIRHLSMAGAVTWA